MRWREGVLLVLLNTTNFILFSSSWNKANQRLSLSCKYLRIYCTVIIFMYSVQRRIRSISPSALNVFETLIKVNTVPVMEKSDQISAFSSSTVCFTPDPPGRGDGAGAPWRWAAGLAPAPDSGGWGPWGRGTRWGEPRGVRQRTQSDEIFL